MKRILAILVTIAILAVFAAGCAGAETKEEPKTKDAGAEQK